MSVVVGLQMTGESRTVRRTNRYTHAQMHIHTIPQEKAMQGMDEADLEEFVSSPKVRYAV